LVAEGAAEFAGSLKFEIQQQDTCTQETKPPKTCSENAGTQLFE
jgi:hypothetical protein